MGLPYIYVAPETPDDWRKWSWNHAANHYDLIAAVQKQKSQTLQQFILDPLNPDDLGLWLYQHQVMHQQINAVLGSGGFDLLSLDWTNPDQFQAWLRQNGDEHVRFSTALGVSS